jgi:hypothetical protein
MANSVEIAGIAVGWFPRVTPSTSSRLDAGSVETSKTFFPASASFTAAEHATEVLPTPPLPVKNRLRVGCSKNFKIGKPKAKGCNIKGVMYRIPENRRVVVFLLKPHVSSLQPALATAAGSTTSVSFANGQKLLCWCTGDPTGEIFTGWINGLADDLAINHYDWQAVSSSGA